MIGERLAEIRKDHGDNQDDLARKLNVLSLIHISEPTRH